MSDKTTPILDMTAGSRMFWWDKQNKRATFVDKREGFYSVTDKNSPGGERTIAVFPDITLDWTKQPLPFPDSTFYMVVFDPPHLLKAGESSWLAKKYGTLDDLWPNQIRRGFHEAMRVLRPNGTLIFKWNDDQIKLADVLHEISYRPLFGDKRSKTHWLVFMKEAEK